MCLVRPFRQHFNTILEVCNELRYTRAKYRVNRCKHTGYVYNVVLRALVTAIPLWFQRGFVTIFWAVCICNITYISTLITWVSSIKLPVGRGYFYGPGNNPLLTVTCNVSNKKFSYMQLVVDTQIHENSSVRLVHV